MQLNQPKFLYVHIPFCRHICSYCGFCRVVFNEDNADKYLVELEKELKSYAMSDLATIYIGGGTPSSLSVLQLEQLFQILKPYSNHCEEYTIEINPETLTEEKVALLKKYSINRVSLGLQAYQDKLLQKLNRFHTYEMVKDCISLLKSYGINNITVDLMYALPTQSMEDWKETLNKTLELNVNHISLYSLTIEENSMFGKQGIQALPQEIEEEMYLYAIQFLEENDFIHYEISNFSKKGSESKHNLAYWNYQDFVGVGLGASGKVNHLRYTNTSSMADYLTGKRYEEEISLTKEDEMFEYIMMNLRKKIGFSTIDFKQKFGEEFQSVYSDIINRLLEEKKLNRIDDRVFVPAEYLPILNSILIEFME